MPSLLSWHNTLTLLLPPQDYEESLQKQSETSINMDHLESDLKTLKQEKDGLEVRSG